MVKKYAEEYLNKEYGMDFFPSEQELEGRKPANSLEEHGVFWVICNWIKDNLYFDIEDTYSNIHGWREWSTKGKGSFNPNDNYELDDPESRLELTDFILNGVVVYAEVTDTETKEIVGYIRLN